MTEKKRIITHNGGFHADDVFAVATLELLLGAENVEVIRTRDPELIASGDYVVDVGTVYDPKTNRFDHHQEGGAGERENGIPYAACGLVWKHHGAQVAGSQDIADAVDLRLIQSIDAHDNGFLLEKEIRKDVRSFLLQDVIGLFQPARGEELTHDAGFDDAVEFAKDVLLRQILFSEREKLLRKEVVKRYEQGEDKRLIVFEEGFVADRLAVALILGDYPEPLYFVRHHPSFNWQLACVVNPPSFFDNRALLPEEWAGKEGGELAEITGVNDAIFCHNGRFMAIAKSKEGAIELAKLALAPRT